MASFIAMRRAPRPDRLRAITWVLATATACAPASRPADSTVSASAGAEIDSAMARYGRFTLQMASESLSATFAADGELVSQGQPSIVGPAAILAHLRTFSDYKVLADSLVADTTTADSASGRQVGRYWQRVRLPKGDTVEVGGGFEARWVRVAPHEWRLRRLATRR